MNRAIKRSRKNAFAENLESEFPDLGGFANAGPFFFKGVQEAGTNRRQGIPKYGRLYAGVGPSLPSRE